MDVKRRSGRLLSSFRSVAAEVPVSGSDFEKVGKGYNRLNEHYRVGHGLSRMLLLTLRPEEFFREGKEEVFGLALDMAEIFERFVERLLADLLGPKGFRLLPQARDSRAILDHDGRTYASVRPDIEVWRAGRPVGVIDAKYKPYWAAASDSGAPGRKISNEDLYQLFFYQQRMQRKYSLPVLPTAAIAAPLPEVDERDGRACIPERFRKIRWQAGVEREGDVRLVLVPITRFLRLLKEKSSPAKAVSAAGLEEVVSLFEDESLW